MVLFRELCLAKDCKFMKIYIQVGRDAPPSRHGLRIERRAVPATETSL